MSSATAKSYRYCLVFPLVVNVFSISGYAFAAPQNPTVVGPTMESDVSPTDTIVLSWLPIPGAINYDYFIYSQDERRIEYKELRFPSESCTDHICVVSVQLPITLESGKYDWRVSARGIDGRSSFTRTEFVILGPKPGMPTGLTASALPVPVGAPISLSWYSVDVAGNYDVLVYDSATSDVVFRNRNVPLSSCSMGICSVDIQESLLQSGVYRWLVAARNSFGKSAFARASESLVVPTISNPKMTFPISGTAVVLGEPIALRWKESDSTLFYDLYLKTQFSEDVYHEKVIANDSCSDGFCEWLVDPGNYALSAGDYEWGVTARWGNIKSEVSIDSFMLVRPFAGPGRFNIVYLMADDLGFGDLNPEDMPRSYALATEYGIQLPFYTAQNCAPTRAALMTGKRPSTVGITGVDPPPNYLGIDPNVPMIPSKLKDAGYATGIFGKWHLGLELEQNPLSRGFDEFVGFIHGWINYYGPTDDGQAYPDGTYGHGHHGAHDFQRDGAPSYESKYSTFIFRDSAIDFINRQTATETPFFIYLPFNAPHGPYAAPKSYVDLLQDRFDVSDSQKALLYEYADGVLAKPAGLVKPDGTNYGASLHRKLDLLLYYAAVRALDDAIADVMEWLKDSGNLSSTFFMFASDNGARPNFGVNSPYRSGKGSPYEGGHRVANFIVPPVGLNIGTGPFPKFWVGDLYPTFAKLAGLDLDHTSDIDGVSILESLSSSMASDIVRNGKEYFVLHELKATNSLLTTDIKFEWAVIKSPFKYIRTGLIDDKGTIYQVAEEIYNLDSDVAESVDLAGVAEYQSTLDEFRNAYQIEGGDVMILEWHTTDRFANWGDFVLPIEWGFAN